MRALGHIRCHACVEVRGLRFRVGSSGGVTQPAKGRAEARWKSLALSRDLPPRRCQQMRRVLLRLVLLSGGRRCTRTLEQSLTGLGGGGDTKQEPTLQGSC